MQELLLVGGSPGQVTERQTKLLTINLLYATQEGEPTKLLTTNLLYAYSDNEPTKLLTVNLLYAIPEV